MNYFLKLNFSDEILPLINIKLNVLQIENTNLFRKIVSSLYYMANVDALIALFKENELLEMDSSTLFITNLIDFDLNTKKNLNSLSKMILNTYYENINTDLEQLKLKMIEIAKKLSLELDISLDIKETIKVDDLFKVIDIKFREEYETPLKRFLNYLYVISELQGKYIFFTLHLKEYFLPEEIIVIIKELALHEIILVDIETQNISNLGSFEKRIIVDKDC